MTTVKIEAVFEAMPENEAQASLLIANALFYRYIPAPKERETLVARGVLPDNNVHVTVHMPRVYTVIGYYEDNGQTWVETLTGHTPEEVSGYAPEGVRVIAVVLGDMEVL